MTNLNQYRSKCISAEEAAKLVKSGDWVNYGSATLFPVLCDAALAKRKDELFDVKIRGSIIFNRIEVAECDDTHEHFTYCSWHTTAYERKLCDKGQCFYDPMLFRNLFWYYEKHLDVDVAFVCAAPMDEDGYFNFSLGTGTAWAPLQRAKIIVIEVNENLPRCFGGNGSERIHISQVTYVVEGEHKPVVAVPMREPSPVERAIAEQVIPYIADGATIQLGIGGVPDALGMMIAESDLKDLGMHTEICSDAFLHLHNSGKLTNSRKNIDKGRGVFGSAQGTQALYDWIKENPELAAYPMYYINDPYVISQLDNFVSLNSCIAVDLYGQVSSESSGLRHISGTGGQVDFLTGASMSKGGKAFICMSSTFTDKSGQVKSRIVPYFTGDIVTSPRSQAYYIATEHGVANLVGRSTWERAERLIAIADPAFREDLIKAAEAQHIWRRSNKR